MVKPIDKKNYGCGNLAFLPSSFYPRLPFLNDLTPGIAIRAYKITSAIDIQNRTIYESN